MNKYTVVAASLVAISLSFVGYTGLQVAKALKPNPSTATAATVKPHKNNSAAKADIPKDGDKLKVVAKTDDIAYSVDLSTVEESGGLKTFLVLATFAPSDDPNYIPYVSQRVVIDCEKNQLQILNANAIDKEGNVINHKDYTDAKWLPIGPDENGGATIGQGISSLVCAKPGATSESSNPANPPPNRPIHGPRGKLFTA